jgi:CCR4-NOT transcription complex subunit 7/8
MSENNKFKSINNALDINLSLNSIDEISTKRFISTNNINNSNNEQPGIIEVYEDNFIEEIKKLSSLLEEYNYIGMDTEFPGIVYCVQNLTKDFYYRTLKMNIDSLKLIQLGVTLMNSKGEFPKNSKYHTWQFNFEFDKNKDKITQPSLNLLEQCGIDFNKLKRNGIKHKDFSEYFMVSGLVLNPDIHWISFHGSYDFGYLLKYLICTNLPETEIEFMNLLNIYFINYYDIKTLVKTKDNLKIGLNKLAQSLEVLREGKTHQAGSDSVVTIDVYFKLIKSGFIGETNIKYCKNLLFGINNEEDNKETITYEQFSHLFYQNNKINNLLFPQYVNNYYYYQLNNNITQHNNNPTNISTFIK